MDVSDLKNFDTLYALPDFSVSAIVLFAVQYDKESIVFYRDTFSTESNIKKLYILDVLEKN